MWTTATSGGDAALAKAAPAWPKLLTLADARAAPDRPWLATRDARGAALADAALARAQRAHGGGDITSAFSADGRWLASSGRDGSLRLWPLATADLIADACTRSARNLTREEWQRHFGNEAYRRSCPGLPPAAGRRALSLTAPSATAALTSRHSNLLVQRQQQGGVYTYPSMHSTAGMAAERSRWPTPVWPAGRAHDQRCWVMKQELKTPDYTTRWADLPTARA